MAKRPTPIERAIAGEPVDRQARYEKRLLERALVRLTLLVPVEAVDDLKRRASELRNGSAANGDD